MVVIGASAGGIEALNQIIPRLPEDLPASVVVVMHLAPEARSALPTILARKTLLLTTAAHDGAAIEHGHVYVAPPDRHVLFEGGRVRLTRGPRENGHRPAIDATFRSAARAYGDRVIGIVLSGNLGDGAVGLHVVEEAGGITIVQDPADALHPSMPSHAIEYDDPHHIAPASEIGALITHFVSEPINSTSNGNPGSETFEDGKVVALSCPDCGGPIAELQGGDNPRFVCRVGHSFSTESLFAEQGHALETALWTAIRVLQERGDLATRLAERLEARGADVAARRFRLNAEDVRDQAAIVRSVMEDIDTLADDTAEASEDELTAAASE